MARHGVASPFPVYTLPAGTPGPSLPGLTFKSFGVTMPRLRGTKTLSSSPESILCILFVPLPGTSEFLLTLSQNTAAQGFYPGGPPPPKPLNLREVSLESLFSQACFRNLLSPPCALPSETVPDNEHLHAGPSVVPFPFSLGLPPEPRFLNHGPPSVLNSLFQSPYPALPSFQGPLPGDVPFPYSPAFQTFFQCFLSLKAQFPPGSPLPPEALPYSSHPFLSSWVSSQIEPGPSSYNWMHFLMLLSSS